MTNKDCKKPPNRETHKKPFKATTAKHWLLKRIGTHSPAIIETRTTAKIARIKVLMSKEVTKVRETEADDLHRLTTGRTDEAIADKMIPTGTEIKLMTETKGRISTGRIRGGISIVTKVVAMSRNIGTGSQASGGEGRSVVRGVIEGTGEVGQGKGWTETEEVKEEVDQGIKLAIASANAGKSRPSTK